MTLTELFTNIANAIRAKTGSTEPIIAEDFPSAIEAIDVGVSCNTCTITIADDAFKEDNFPTISCTVLENNTIQTVTETITSDYKQINNVVCGSTAVIIPAEGTSL